MAIGINSVNPNIFAKPVETVSGNELTQAVKDIFSASSTSAVPTFSGITINKSAPVEVSLYGTNASSNTNAIKLAATNTAGYELEFSGQTLASINALNAKAAANLVNNVASLRNGMIHINSEQPDFTVLKNIHNLSDAPHVFETADLSKDRKGSGPFRYVQKNDGNKSEKTGGLNFVA